MKGDRVARFRAYARWNTSGMSRQQSVGQGDWKEGSNLKILEVELRDERNGRDKTEIRRRL